MAVSPMHTWAAAATSKKPPYTSSKPSSSDETSELSTWSPAALRGTSLPVATQKIFEHVKHTVPTSHHFVLCFLHQEHSLVFVLFFPETGPNQTSCLTWWWTTLFASCIACSDNNTLLPSVSNDSGVLESAQEIMGWPPRDCSSCGIGL